MSFVLVQLPSQGLQLVFITLSIVLQYTALFGGYFLVYPDYAGQYGGVLFGLANSVTQLNGVAVPALVAHLAPNVR